MDLDLEIIGDLTPDHLARADAPKEDSRPTIKQLRDSHHALARLLASGMSNEEASLVTGYDPDYISTLKAAPAFENLLRFYHGQQDLAYEVFHQRAATARETILFEIQHRVENEPEKIGFGSLVKALEVMADRTGHGPQTTNVNVNIDLAERLQAARKRLTQGEVPCPPILELHAEPALPETAPEGDSSLPPKPREEPVA